MPFRFLSFGEASPHTAPTWEDVMADPFQGEIRVFTGNSAPSGWALCQGQLMPIAENDALFSLIGTTYGGDGQNTFVHYPQLLAGSIPIHQGRD